MVLNSLPYGKNRGKMFAEVISFAVMFALEKRDFCEHNLAVKFCVR